MENAHSISIPRRSIPKICACGLASSFPLTYAMMLMGSLSLSGFPFLTGFYSKDVILELAYTKGLGSSLPSTKSSLRVGTRLVYSKDSFLAGT
jgi:NADH:ubiquinone oxidoreductase subunit 5 (subunit L)/multisubunit Na+/H+ antiporter MnhA subunit